MSDEILNYIKDTVDRIEVKQDGHDTRLRTVENWQSNASGKMSIIGLIGATIGGILTATVQLFRH